jgi:hypothetical protein
MGLAIDSELFQQVMTENLKHIPNQRLATEMVLNTLAELGVTLSSVGKCEFLKTEITFYGHKISAEGIKPLESKNAGFYGHE